MGQTQAEVIVIGAGIAGLACARVLADAGVSTLVVNKGRGLGGRCATRRFDEQPIDHGLPFFHGADPDFIAALERVEGATPIEGWPVRVDGTGAPCQPRAFEPHERRLAFVEGVSAFPKHLARGIEVRLDTTIERLALGRDEVELVAESGERFSAPTAVVALPVERIRSLLGLVTEKSPELTAAEMIFGMSMTLPCLTVLAGYPLAGPEPPWDAYYPETSTIIQLAAHDSAKRRSPRFRVMVYQCLPRWSRLHQADLPDAWVAAVIAEAGRRFGDWAATPSWVQGHRWRLARIAGGSELAGPMLIGDEGGARLGFAGELFSASGGAQAAWRSGNDLAAHILGRTNR